MLRSGLCDVCGMVSSLAKAKSMIVMSTSALSSKNETGYFIKEHGNN
jgi:hypothetical protein